MLFRVAVVVALLLITAVTAITTKTHQTCTPFNIAAVRDNFLTTMATNIHTLSNASGQNMSEGSICAKNRFVSMANDTHPILPTPRSYLEMLLWLKNEMHEPPMMYVDFAVCTNLERLVQIRAGIGERITFQSDDQTRDLANLGYRATQRSIHRCLDAAIVEFYGQPPYCGGTPSQVLL
jgi:hypothetical protein